MKRPSPASLKRVTAENLTRLGADRLAAILLEVASTRVELKRRLRMELAAEQGAQHLRPEIDRRLAVLASSRGVVSWRQRPAFVRDLEGLRGLIYGRLAELDLPAAQDRIIAFLAIFPQVMRRIRDKEGAAAAVFDAAAADAAALLSRGSEQEEAAGRLADAIAAQPGAWGRWSERALQSASPQLAAATLGFLSDRSRGPLRMVVRRLADRSGDLQAYRDSFSEEDLRAPAAAADVAARHLRAGDLATARVLLEQAVAPGRAGPDFAWEGVWIEYLEAAGRPQEAQTARWASFERTLSVERARAFTRRLPHFEDVEAEARMFQRARGFPDAARGLEFLMGWPALREAAELVLTRGAELSPEPGAAEAWSRQLLGRHPEAAEALLRRSAAAAFRRGEFATAARLTEEADGFCT